MVRDEACGTYWYCVNKNGSRWLTAGAKPERVNGCYRLGDGYSMGWLGLDLNSSSSYALKDGITVGSQDFSECKFPEITYEDGPIEVEIVKSGNVYWYDN